MNKLASDQTVELCHAPPNRSIPDYGMAPRGRCSRAIEAYRILDTKDTQRSGVIDVLRVDVVVTAGKCHTSAADGRGRVGSSEIPMQVLVLGVADNHNTSSSRIRREMAAVGPHLEKTAIGFSDLL